MHPRVFYKVINTLLYRFKKETIPEAIKYRDIIQLFFFYNGLVLVQGVAFYFFVNALCYVPLQNLVGLTASFAVAGALGTVSFFAPSGLGVREGILALLLSTYIVSTSCCPHLFAGTDMGYPGGGQLCRLCLEAVGVLSESSWVLR